MDLSRRHFLRLSALAAGSVAAIGSPLDPLLAAPAEAAPLQQAVRAAPVYDLATWTPLVNATFKVKPAIGAAVNLVLKSVTDLSTQQMAGAKPLAGPDFSLVFSGASRSRFSSAMCVVSHPAIGHAKLFVVPVGQNLNYQVIVNNRVPVK